MGAFFNLNAYSMNIETTCNTSDDILFEQIKFNSHRSNDWLFSADAHDGFAVIVGGGPSVADWIDEIRARKQHGQTIFALNGAARWLAQHDIEADYCIIVDAREINLSMLGYAKQYLLASQCHPSLFDACPDALLWHQEYPQDMARFDACLPANPPAHTLIGGGTTVGLSGMVVAYAMGYRSLHLYGYDSSYRNGHCHAYSQNDPQRVDCVATVAGKQFQTTLAMAKQAELFPQLSDSLIDLGCTITIRGDGLLPWTSKASAIAPEPIDEQDKYKAMWSIDAYRNAAPGEGVADLFCLATLPTKSSTVIDFGAGTGRGAMRIHDAHDCHVLMLDFADNCLDERVRAKLGDKLRFAVADLTQPIPHRADYGFCTDVMEHIPPEQVSTVIHNIMAAAPQVFFQISTVTDTMGALIGHPLHLTVQGATWWRNLFLSLGYTARWESKQDTAVMFFVTQPLEEENA